MIAILVPVLGRAHQLKPLLENIANATQVEYRVYFVFSPGDEAIQAAKGTDSVSVMTDWEPGRSDYAKKLGLGFHSSTEPWLFQGASDLIFYQGWDHQALITARRSHARVIGTNDLGNPLVKRGTHSTHSLLARSYIEDWGSGTADHTGVIFSEVYDHQWTDNEFVDTARLRREWAFARRSIVEHMHPHWNKADMDDTYDKAMRSTTKDQQLYMRRRGKVTKLVTQAKRRKART